jgi:hypothetical protein
MLGRVGEGRRTGCAQALRTSIWARRSGAMIDPALLLVAERHAWTSRGSGGSGENIEKLCKLFLLPPLPPLGRGTVRFCYFPKRSLTFADLRVFEEWKRQLNRSDSNACFSTRAGTLSANVR